MGTRSFRTLNKTGSRTNQTYRSHRRGAMRAAGCAGLILFATAISASAQGQPLVILPETPPPPVHVTTLDASGAAIHEADVWLSGTPVDLSKPGPQPPQVELDANCIIPLYENTSTSGSYYAPWVGYEALDFGTSPGGTVCRIAFAYATTLSNPGAITIYFYSGTSPFTCPGSFLIGWSFTGLPGSTNGSAQGFTYAYDIPVDQQFNLPAGAFGYSYQFQNDYTGPLMATGGAGQENMFWENCLSTWFGGSPWAGFYMAVNTSEGADPDIRVEPASVAMSCQPGGNQANADAPAAEPADTATAVEAAPAAAPAVDPAILQDFAAGQVRHRVIVTLATQAKVQTTNFDDPRSVATLRQDLSRRQAATLAALTADEFTPRHRFTNIPAVSGSLTKAGLDKLLKQPGVLAVEPVRTLYPQLRQGLAVMNAEVYRSAYPGNGLSIAICDTGIDYNHPMLGGGGFPNAKVIGGTDTGDNDNDPMDCEGHGTACAGIAAGDLGNNGDYIGGVAPAARLYAVKIVSGCTGSSQSDDMIAGWDWCVTHKNDDPLHPIMVISTSFGGDRFFAACDGASSGMTSAAQAAVAAGITLAVSSGNDGYCDSIAWPACISHVISVGAAYDAAIGTVGFCLSTNSCAPLTPYAPCPTGYISWDNSAADRVTSYSNVSSNLDVFAPSHNAYTTDISGAGGYSSGNYTENFGGTSAACPYTAGAIASLQDAAKTLQGAYLSPAQVRSLLASTGDLISDTKVAITKPRVNLGRAIESLGCPGEFLRIYNDGVGTLEVASITHPAWMTMSLSAPFTIASGASLATCLAPDCDACSGGSLSGDVVINSNDPDTPSLIVPAQVSCTCDHAADLDADCDVDAEDVDIFVDCSTGPEMSYLPTPPAGCTSPLQGNLLKGDFDGDHDLDDADFAVLQRCLSGTGNAPDPDCTN